MEFLETPYAKSGERVVVTALGHDMHDVRLRFGFREEPDVPGALRPLGADYGLADDIGVTYVIARSSIANRPGRLPTWRASLYATMSRQADDAGCYFALPANQVVQLGTHVLI